MKLAIISLLGLVVSVSSQQSHFLSFGTGAGDQRLYTNDDGSGGPYTIPLFPYFGQGYTSLYLNNNGLLSFTSPEYSYTPNPFPITNKPVVAPFWGDVDTRVAGNVYHRQVTDATSLQEISALIVTTYANLASFQATWAFVATYDRVAAYGSSGSVTNTFQVMITTNGVYSFAVYNYGPLGWTYGSASSRIDAQVGFDAGDRINFYAHPDSRTPAIINIHSGSNVGINGRFVYRLDQTQIDDPGVSFCSGVDCNGGQCVNGSDSFICLCNGGYTGQNCEINIDDCLGVNCNYGVCNDGLGSYSCDCNFGYTGEHCEDNIDDCIGVVCQNDGICLDGIAQFTCSCRFDMTGLFCEEFVRFDCNTNSPCIGDQQTRTGKFHFPSVNPAKFVQCDEWGSCYDMSCPGGLVWNAKHQTCDWPEI